jgi:acyl-CoA thioesterase FadM
MSPLNAAICTTTTRQKCYGPGKKILFKNNYLTLRSNVKVPWRSLRYATHRLMVMHPHTKYHWPISKDKNVMAQTRKYYLKNNYLTLRSNIKVPRRSLRYATHRLMVMHPHAKYNWPISKDKNVMARTRKYYLKNNYLTLRSKVKVPRRSLRYATHRLMVMHPHTK